MTGLSLMNPWHAAKTLLNPEVPDNLKYNQLASMADSRQQRSIVDELIPMGPEFIKSKFKAMGPMFKRSVDKYITQGFEPNLLHFGKRSILNDVTDMLAESNSPHKKNKEIMRFGKRSI